jgi:hypothetical protein
MTLRRSVIAFGIAATVLSGCGSSVASTPVDGVVAVTVTLSRSGAIGPSFYRSPQRGVRVTVTDDSGGKWSDETDIDGEAVLAVPSPGEYEVDIGLCPDAAQNTTVARGATAKVRFDCVAP